jgi:hypothetical protein
MKRLLLFGVISVLVTAAVIARAQDAEAVNPPANQGQVSPSDLPPDIHPDTWAHLQRMRRYENPRQMARLKAAEEAQQRRARLNSQRWYGYSPLRPIVGATPTMGNYYPIWNTDVPRPFRWYGMRTYPIEVDLLDPNWD